jgi:Tol biopolymer transport system component
MNLRQKCPTTCIVGGISLLAFAITFSACVPEEPQGPVETRLQFIVDDGTNSYLKSWNPATAQTDVMVTSSMTNGSLEVVSGQPDGAAVLYRSGFDIVLQAGSFYTVTENAAGQYVKRYVKPHSTAENQAPTWAPDGAHLAWPQAFGLRVAPWDGAPTRFGPDIRGFFWSPDGRKVVYTKWTTGTSIAARAYDVTTGEDIQIDNDVEGGYTYDYRGGFTWLSDSRHIVISADKHVVVDATLPDPANAREIADNEGGIIPSPDGDRFVLVYEEEFPSTVRHYSLTLNDGNAAIPLPDTFYRTSPVWSSNGDYLYFVTDADADGILDVVTINASGQVQQTVTTGVPAIYYTLIQFSPKNDKIAFAHQNSISSTTQLTVVDLPSGNLHTQSIPAVGSYIALWSPNGRYLAWGNDYHDLYLYDSNSPDATSQRMNSGETVLSLRNGEWSRDSKHIALCRGAEYYSCPLTVISTTAGNLTYTALPDSANGFLWTGKK